MNSMHDPDFEKRLVDEAFQRYFSEGASLEDSADFRKDQLWFTRIPEPAEPFHVPSRFGMSGIMAITTLMAIVFGVVQHLAIDNGNRAEQQVTAGHPLVYVVLSVLVFATCIVQMCYGTVPRGASITTGAIVLPLSYLLCLPFVDRPVGIDEVVGFTFSLIIFGSLCGYFAGTLTAGTFLLVDRLESWTRRRASQRERIRFDDGNASGNTANSDIVMAELVEGAPPAQKPIGTHF